MSSIAQAEEPVRRAVPFADLSAIDVALKKPDDALREALKTVRAADVGRDLSRRTIEQGRRILSATDDRSSAMMLKTAHPVTAAHLLRACDLPHVARMLEFLPVERQVAILGSVDADLRARVEAELDAKDRRDIQRLLSYPPSAVGRYATPKIWRCQRDALAKDALEELRRDEAAIEVAQNLYITD